MRSRDMTDEQKIDLHLKIAAFNVCAAGVFALGSVAVAILIALGIPPPW